MHGSHVQAQLVDTVVPDSRRKEPSLEEQEISHGRAALSALASWRLSMNARMESSKCIHGLCEGPSQRHENVDYGSQWYAPVATTCDASISFEGWFKSWLLHFPSNSPPVSLERQRKVTRWSK